MFTSYKSITFMVIIFYRAHTNTSVKSDATSPKSSNPATPSSASQQPNNTNKGSQNDLSNPNNGSIPGGLSDCVKQEPDNDFADLDQCAAALEKDAAANGGNGFGGLSDLIGDDTTDQIIPPDALKDLISDITSYSDLMQEFDFEDKADLGGPGGLLAGLKVEDLKELHQQIDIKVPTASIPHAGHIPQVILNNIN